MKTATKSSNRKEAAEYLKKFVVRKISETVADMPSENVYAAIKDDSLEKQAVQIINSEARNLGFKIMGLQIEGVSGDALRKAIHRKCPNCEKEIRGNVIFCPHCKARVRRFELENAHERLENLIKAGRYEAAAREYEKFWMYEKAGKLRQRTREIRVVQVNLNALIRQLGERGLTFTYHCSHCGSPLRIDGETSPKVIKFCKSCGSRIEAIDLKRLIESYLS